MIVEHRVEEALDLRPDRVLYLDEESARYLGTVDGFLAIADPDAVKLPFEVVLARAPSARRVVRLPEPRRPRRRTARPRRASTSAATATRVPGRARPARETGEVLHGDRRAALGAREVVAVLGPNGSGKTTLFRTAMRLLARHAAARSSSTARRGTRATVAQLATIFGYVFQSPSQMLFARTVREELTFGPRNLRPGPAEPSTRSSTDALAPDGARRARGHPRRPPLTLSFGQQKRLALAIALALQPPTLILDEPSAGQDHRTAGRFMREVLAIPGLEVVYLVTHDVDLALTHANRILLFRDGRIVADGPPAGGHRGRRALAGLQPDVDVADARERALGRTRRPVPRR